MIKRLLLVIVSLGFLISMAGLAKPASSAVSPSMAKTSRTASKKTAAASSTGHQKSATSHTATSGAASQPKKSTAKKTKAASTKTTTKAKTATPKTTKVTSSQAASASSHAGRHHTATQVAINHHLPVKSSPVTLADNSHSATHHSKSTSIANHANHSVATLAKQNSASVRLASSQHSSHRSFTTVAVGTSHSHHSQHLLASNSSHSDWDASALNSNVENEATAGIDWGRGDSQQRLVALAEKSIENLRYTNYRLGGTYFDIMKGVYILDCSDYVDHLLRQASPTAYSSVASWTHTSKPTTSDYFAFFSNLSGGSESSWRKVDRVSQLLPGDILVFRYRNRSGHSAGGHVMVVMGKPVRSGGAFLVKVADSASAGHDGDTRPAHTSGVGMGTLLLKASPFTNHPQAYAWRSGTPWEANVEFAMGRPITV